eukprot:m51a1_g6913 hypothetical protein (236) ;mRNA; f:128511-129355
MSRLPLLLDLLLALLPASQGLLCSTEVGSGCSVWRPAAAGDLQCQICTAVPPGHLIEVRIPESAGPLVPRFCQYVRLLGNVSIGCQGCQASEATHAFFYETTGETGAIVVRGRAEYGPPNTAFSLGVHSESGIETPRCTGGFFYRNGTAKAKDHDLVEVRLGSSVSTGYVWEADVATPPEAEFRLPCGNVPGCSERRFFFFRAGRQQQVRVNLLNVRGQAPVVQDVVAIDIELSH